MDNQNPQQVTPIQESSAATSANISPTPPPHNTRKFKIIFVSFFVIFFLTIGTAAAVYTFKEVSRSNSDLDKTPTISPQPSAVFEVSPIPTSLPASGECVVGGCSGQFCISKSESEGFVSTCEYKEEYACYKTATCELQASGTCGWTQVPELTSCLESAK